jgi:hypothetical protein
MDLPDIFAAEKTMVAVGSWVERDPHRRGDLLTYVSALEIDGVSIPGLRVRATCFRSLPDEAVSIQLEYHRPRQHGGALSRIEWNPLKPHNNKGRGPPEFRFVEITQSHIHPFDLNWNETAKQLRRGNLPIAIPIELELKDFSSLLAFAGKSFRINKIEDMPVPEWRGDLFRHGRK